MDLLTKTSLLTAVALLALSGCARMVPFTHEIRVQNQLEEPDVRQLQYYLSHDITLRREALSNGRNIRGGRLELSSGKLIEEVVIPKHTPGVAVAVASDAITVSFEEGSALTFGVRSGRIETLPLRQEPSLGFAEPPDPFPGDRPQLTQHEPLADLLGSYYLDTDTDTALVTFQGRVWDAVEESHQAHLMIDAKELEDVVESRTVLGGRRVGQAFPRTRRLETF